MALQGNLAEILQTGIVGIGIVGRIGQRDLGVISAGEIQELVDLVAGKIGQDATVGIPVEKPVGSRRAVQPVRADADGLNDPPDGTLRHKLGSAGDGGHLEPFGKSMDQMRRVVSTVCLIARSCSGVVQPGLSVSTSLPASIAAMAQAARSRGTPASITKSTD